MTGLASILEMVGRGQPLPADGGVTLLPAPIGAATAAVLGFTGRHVIAADVDPDWVRTQLGDASDGADPASPPPDESPAETVDPAQVHPASVASLRAFLAAGFRPVGAEVLFSALQEDPPT